MFTLLLYKAQSDFHSPTKHHKSGPYDLCTAYGPLLSSSAVRFALFYGKDQHKHSSKSPLVLQGRKKVMVLKIDMRVDT